MDRRYRDAFRHSGLGLLPFFIAPLHRALHVPQARRTHQIKRVTARASASGLEYAPGNIVRGGIP